MKPVWIGNAVWFAGACLAGLVVGMGRGAERGEKRGSGGVLAFKVGGGVGDITGGANGDGHVGGIGKPGRAVTFDELVVWDLTLTDHEAERRFKEALDRMSVGQVRALAGEVRDAGRCEVWACGSYPLVHEWLVEHAPKALVGDLVPEAEWERAYEMGDEDLDLEGEIADGLIALVGDDPEYVEFVLRGLKHNDVKGLVWDDLARQCGTRDLLKLMDVARATLDEDDFGTVVARLFDGLAGESDVEMDALLTEFADGPGGDEALVGMAGGLGRSDPEAGWRLVAGIEDKPLRLRALIKLLEEVIRERE